MRCVLIFCQSFSYIFVNWGFYPDLKEYIKPVSQITHKGMHPYVLF